MLFYCILQDLHLLSPSGNRVLCPDVEDGIWPTRCKKSGSFRLRIQVLKLELSLWTCGDTSINIYRDHGLGSTFLRMILFVKLGDPQVVPESQTYGDDIKESLSRITLWGGNGWADTGSLGVDGFHKFSSVDIQQLDVDVCIFFPGLAHYFSGLYPMLLKEDGFHT